MAFSRKPLVSGTLACTSGAGREWSSAASCPLAAEGRRCRQVGSAEPWHFGFPGVSVFGERSGEPGSSGGWWAAGTRVGRRLQGSRPAASPRGRCAPLSCFVDTVGFGLGLRGLGAFRRFLLCLVFDCELPMLFSQIYVGSP